MWKKTTASPTILALLAGLGTVLAFPPIRITSAVFLCPFLLILAVERCKTSKGAFWAGFVTSLAIMLGGFYWVVYVLHVFGFLPWSIAAGIYFIFCGFGALGFPFFAVTLFRAHRRFPSLLSSPAWFTLGIPSLFVVFEFFVPKLFPWYVGHAFYESLWLIQISEYTGSAFLTFLVFSWGGLGVYRLKARKPAVALLVPSVLTALAAGLGVWRLSHPFPVGQTKRIALIQANIGSLDKVLAREGLTAKVQYTIDRHLKLSQDALADPKKPDLLLWPETAMPFSLTPDAGWPGSIRRAVVGWNIPLISGGYAPLTVPPYGDHNSAFLIEPRKGSVRTDIYNKNILLAFGEYFPGGEMFPTLYRWFPEVSDFKRGRDQKVFTLQDGIRLGVTICYEDIVPRFYSKIASQGVHAVVNLTNDSWFGPTSEPYQHAALAVFRSVETRTPLVRVTNTGISFAVDRYGKMSQTTKVYNEGVLNVDVDLPPEPVTTTYLRFGDWFIGLLLLVLAGFWFRAKHVPLPT